MTNTEIPSIVDLSRSYKPDVTCPPVHPHPTKPTIVLPAGATDAHCHIFGPFSHYPLDEKRTFTPRPAPKEQLIALHDFLGFERSVIVESSCYGNNHSLLLDALRSSNGRFRGEALINEGTSPQAIRELDDAGVRGFRLNYLPHLRTAPTQHEIEALRELVRPFGWHTQIHVEGTGVAEHEDMIANLDGTVVLDHMCRVHLSDGLDSPSVHAMKRLLDSGKVWVKVSGIDRISDTGAPFEDAITLANMLVEHAPERVLWGTDYPHVNMVGPAPDDGQLTDALAAIAPTPALLEKLLVTNPAEVFGF